MAGRSFDSAHRGLQGAHRTALPANRPPLRSLRSRLLVLTPSTADAVRCAGGWLFDRRMAGWNVTVLTPDRVDPRPLRILGVRAADLHCALSSPLTGPLPHAIAVCAGLHGADPRARRMISRALGEPVEITLWDGTTPAHDSALSAAQGEWLSHRLSAAARAFKAHAMKAAAVSTDSAGTTEFFRKGEPAEI
jgi:hypothetical protein